MNNVRKTEALVLRVSPYANTSHVVTWFTADRGTVTTIVKGAMRPRSGFLGQYDLFYTCELLYYARERGGVHIAKACSPIASRPALRERWRAYAAASYAAHLLLRVAQPENAEHRLYVLANSFLDRLQLASEPPAETCLWFETRFLAASGFGPKLDRCAACGKSPRHSESNGTSWNLLPGRGVVTCPACALPGKPSEAVSLGRKSLLRMIEWADEAWDKRSGSSSSAASTRLLAGPPAEDLLPRQGAGATGRRFHSHTATPPAPSGISRHELLETGHALGRLAELHLHVEPAYRKLAYELSSVRTERRAPLEKRP